MGTIGEPSNLIPIWRPIPPLRDHRLPAWPPLKYDKDLNVVPWAAAASHEVLEGAGFSALSCATISAGDGVPLRMADDGVHL